MEQIFHKLPLQPEQWDILQERILQHRRFARIYFQVLRTTEEEVLLGIKQEDSFHDNQFDNQRLHDIGHETFGDMIQDRQLSIVVIEQ